MKFVSYNIQFGTGLDGIYDVERIASCLKDADVIALQEVTRGFFRNDHTDLVAAITAFFPDFFWAFGPACDVHLDMVVEDGQRKERRFQFGNMILSRWPIIATRHLLLPRSHRLEQVNMQRGATEVVITTPDGDIRVYSVHCDHISPDERILQIRFLKERVTGFLREGGALTGAREYLVDDPPMPEDYMLMGDFNMEPESPEYIEMVGRKDRYYGRCSNTSTPVDVLDRLGCLTAQSYTWKSSPAEKNAAMHLDYCFVNSGLMPRIKQAYVDTAATGSDHFPLWIELE